MTELEQQITEEVEWIAIDAGTDFKSNEQAEAMMNKWVSAIGKIVATEKRKGQVEELKQLKLQERDYLMVSTPKQTMRAVRSKYIESRIAELEGEQK